MKVTLVSRVAYYRFAALALHRAGLLERYVCEPMLPVAPGPLSMVPPLERRLRRRVCPEVGGLPLRRLWAAQLASSTVQVAARSVCRERSSAPALRARLWEADALLRTPWRQARPGDALHLMVGMGPHLASAARRRGIAVVGDVRSFAPAVRARLTTDVLGTRGISYRSPDEALTRRVLEELDRVDFVVCNSHATAASYVEVGLDATRIAVVYPGTDVDTFHPAEQEPSVFTVLFAGRDPLGKGVLDLLDAARALSPRSRVLISSPADRRIGAHPSTGAQVGFIGQVPAPEMPGLLRRVSVLVLPSLSDGFGLVALEAMASGLPVVVSDRCGVAELVTDGVDGFVVPAADPDALADRLRRLEADRDLRRRIGAAARRTALTHSWYRYGEDLLACYRRWFGVPVEREVSPAPAAPGAAQAPGGS